GGPRDRDLEGRHRGRADHSHPRALPGSDRRRRGHPRPGCTTRPRPDGRTFPETVEAVRTRFDGPLMADCDSLESALIAADAGVEIIGSTLAGYTEARPRTDGPDLALIEALADQLPGPAMLVAEGR